jgi:hypothetical protein
VGRAPAHGAASLPTETDAIEAALAVYHRLRSRCAG